jgi:hypothetical protein
MWQSLWEKLGTDQGLVILGFVLSSLLGGLVAYLFQQLSWRRQAKLDLYGQRYRDGNEFLDRLSSRIDRRYFALKRLLWAVEEDAEPGKLAARERAYFKTVIEWNNNLRAMHNRVRLVIGEAEALAFLDYEDDYRQEDPRSLHYQFLLAHRALMQAKADRSLLDVARREADRLNWTLSSFLYDVTTLFAARANSLALLRVPDGRADESKPRYISGPPAQVKQSREGRRGPQPT